MVEDVHELQVSNDMVLWFPVISYTTVIIFVFVILSTGFFVIVLLLFVQFGYNMFGILLLF